MAKLAPAELTRVSRVLKPV